MGNTPDDAAFVELVTQMRAAQIAFYANRSKERLKLALDLERQVDRWLKDRPGQRRQQPSLLDALEAEDES